MEHEVWKVLDKQKYTDDYIKVAEKQYDFIKELVDKAGKCTSIKNDKAVPVMKEFFDMWNEYSSETFSILQSIVCNDERGK